MDAIFKELDWSDSSFLKEIISEFNGQMISDFDLQNRITFIMNSPFDQLYICIQDNVIPTRHQIVHVFYKHKGTETRRIHKLCASASLC
jgi:hypothetical protein